MRRTPVLIFLVALVFGPPRLLNAQVAQCATIDVAALQQPCRNSAVLIGEAIAIYAATQPPAVPVVDIPARTICFPGAVVAVPSIITQAAIAARCDARVAAAAADAAEKAAILQDAQTAGCFDTRQQVEARLNAASFSTEVQRRNEFKRLWACWIWQRP